MQPGGIEVLVRGLIAGLPQRAEVFLVSADRSIGDLPPDLQRNLVGHFAWRPDSGPELATRLAGWLRDNAIDVVHFHLGTYGWNHKRWSHNPIVLAARTGIACVSTNHGAFSIWNLVGEEQPLPIKLLAFAVRWPIKLRQLASVRWEATVSQNDLRSVRKWFFPLRGKFIQLYHSKISGATGGPGDHKDPIILCLGTIGGRKGQHYLVEAFARVAGRFPEWRLVLAGRRCQDATYQCAIEWARRSGLGDRIAFLHDVTDTKAEQWLRRSAIFAMPSTAEGLGLSLQEAQFHRCACIGSRVGGIPELIGHERSGLLVPPGDPAALAEGLGRLMADEDLRVRFGATGSASIEGRGMTSAIMVSNYLALYRKALEDRGEAAR